MEETKVNIKPKVTRSSLRLSALDNLKEATEDTRKSSEKLKRIFERNTYQKKTQLTVLKRYKRRLDAIEREEEERRKRASRRKIKVPQIKKFMGSFFAPGASNDPMKAIGALALFKTGTNLSEGKLLDAFASGLTAAGLIAGPALLGMGINSVFNRGGGQRKPSTGGFKIRNPFKRGPKVTGDAGGFNIRNPFRKKPKITGNAGKFSNVGKAFGRFGKSIVPIAGAALGAADAAIRANEGDITGSAIAGTSAALDAYAAAAAATGVGLPAAGILSVVSFGLDMVNLVRDLSGASDSEAKKRKREKAETKKAKPGETETQRRLREQTEKQKELVRQTPEETGPLTFRKTLNGYEKVIKKFEEFSKMFKLGSTTGEDGVIYPEAPNITPEMEYTGPISGETFFPLPGGKEGQQANQQFGASRDGGSRSHAGLDMVKWTGNIEAPVVAYKTGRVIESVKAGYNGYVTISHGKGLATRYYHMNPSVSVGQTVYGGEQIGTLFNDGENTHLHFEVIVNGTKVDPKAHGTGRNRITSPLSRDRAKEHHDKSETPIDQKPTQKPVEANPTTDKKNKPTQNPNIKPTTTSVTISGYTYEKKGNKFYENGKEISEQLMRAVMKNHSSKFKGWVSRNIEVDTDKSKVALIMVPTPTPSQQQPPQMNGGGSNFTVLNNDVNRVVANLSYNKTLLLS